MSLFNAEPNVAKRKGKKKETVKSILFSVYIFSVYTYCAIIIYSFFFFFVRIEIETSISSNKETEFIHSNKT